MIQMRRTTAGPRYRDERLWWAAAGAMALHVAMLASGHAPDAQSMGRHGSANPTTAMSAAMSEQAPVAWQLVHRLQGAAERAHHSPDDQPADHQTHQVSSPAVNPAMGTPSMPPLLAQGAHQEAPFWRRHEVDQGPIPLHPVIIPYPDGVQVAQVVRGIITLYIDELGVVRRVEPKDRTLAPAMVQAARDAFLQARFQPALRQQAPARVQIDIEVQFDPPEAPPGNRSLTPGL
jgi:outer membrane biosynthesis protein TonB